MPPHQQHSPQAQPPPQSTKPEDLKALQKLWYEKLKSEGFDDIEDGPYLKEWDSFYFQTRHEPQSFSLKHEYYYLAEHFLTSFEFKSEIEKEIWRLHSEGLGFRDISKAIKRLVAAHTPYCTQFVCDLFCENKLTHAFIINKDKVAFIIAKFKKIMLTHPKNPTDE